MDGDILCGVEFGPAYLLKGRFHYFDVEGEASNIVLGKVLLALEQGREYDEPISLMGTNFQKEVWHTIRKVPYGKTITYKEIAEHIGKPKAIRAVASAVGANPIAYIVPCHRVVRQDGADSGYRWGLPLKQKLLDKEYHITHPMMIGY